MSGPFAEIDPNSQLGSINDEDDVHVFFQRENGHIYDQKYQPRGQRYSVHNVTSGLISPPTIGAPFAVLLVKTIEFKDETIYGTDFRLYLRGEGGTIREYSRDATKEDSAWSLRKESGEGIVMDPKSQLGAMTTGTNSSVVFYQVEDGTINYWYPGNKTSMAIDLGRDCYPRMGTALAAGSAGGSEMTVIFQASRGGIYELNFTQVGAKQTWELGPEIAQPRLGTPLVLMPNWGGRIYYFNQDNLLEELCRNFDGTWFAGDVNKKRLVGSITTGLTAYLGETRNVEFRFQPPRS